MDVCSRDLHIVKITSAASLQSLAFASKCGLISAQTEQAPLEVVIGRLVVNDCLGFGGHVTLLCRSASAMPCTCVPELLPPKHHYLQSLFSAPLPADIFIRRFVRVHKFMLTTVVQTFLNYVSGLKTVE